MAEQHVMPTGAPPLPPESMWPTGDMPPELRIAMAQESAAMNAAAGHEIVPSGIAVPPRDFDAAALEAERPPIEEGDALIARLRSVAGNGHARPPMRPAIPTFATPSSPVDMHYAFPLSADVRAEVNIYGKATAADVGLLVDYLKLTEKKMVKHGDVIGLKQSGDLQQDSQSDRIDPPRTRGRVGKRIANRHAT